MFNTSILKFLVKIDIDAGLNEQTKERMMEVVRADFVKAGIPDDLSKRLVALIDDCRYQQANLISDDINQYCSMLHNDLWVNNMMIKYGKEGCFALLQMSNYSDLFLFQMRMESQLV